MSATQEHYDRAGVTAGSLGFALAVLLIIGGTAAHRPDTTIAGCVIAAIGAATTVMLEVISHREVTHAQTTPLVEEPVPPHP